METTTHLKHIVSRDIPRRKLLAKYPWYDTWHNHPKHELFHWVLFSFVAVFVAITAFFNVSVGFGQTGRSEGAKAEIAPASSGKIMGRVSDQILVMFEPNIGQSKKNAILARHGLQEKSAMEKIGVDIVSIAAKDTPEEAVRRLVHEDGVIFAEVDAIVEPSFIPNDPDYPSEWHQVKINSPVAWDSVAGAGITIAIADTGVDSSQPDLTANLVPGWNFVDNNSDTSDAYGHGTAVAGAAAASGNNNIEVAGVAYGANIMPLKIAGANGYTTYSLIASAVSYGADHGAKVVNVSYQAGGSAVVQRAARYAKRNGTLTVMSEGNTGGPSGYKNSPDIISVSATDDADAGTSWSTYGPDVDVAAPGLAILTTAMGGTTNYYSGTSFSAPLTAGVIALIWSVNPALTPDQVQKILFNSATDLGAPGWDQNYGWGRIDAGQAIVLSRQ